MPEEELELHPRPRATEAVSIQIPADTLVSIKEVAAQRDMSEQALLKLYIGQGLRQDLAKRFSDRVLDSTAQILARYVPSPEQVSAIMREIRIRSNKFIRRASSSRRPKRARLDTLLKGAFQ